MKVSPLLAIIRFAASDLEARLTDIGIVTDYGQIVYRAESRKVCCAIEASVWALSARWRGRPGRGRLLGLLRHRWRRCRGSGRAARRRLGRGLLFLLRGGGLFCRRRQWRQFHQHGIRTQLGGTVTHGHELELLGLGLIAGEV